MYNMQQSAKVSAEIAYYILYNGLWDLIGTDTLDDAMVVGSMQKHLPPMTKDEFNLAIELVKEQVKSL